MRRSRSHPKSSPTDELHFAILVVEGFTLVCVAGFIEVLRVFCDQGTHRSNRRCKWTILSDTEPTSSVGITLASASKIADPSHYDYIVLIGGKRPRRSPLQERTISFLRKADRCGVPIASVTAGTFELARLGLLDGYSACVHWDHLREFNIEFPHIEASCDTIFLDDRGRITCAGGTYAIDLALYLLAQHFKDSELRTTMGLMGLHEIRRATHFQKHLLRAESATDEMRINRLIRMIETRTESPPTVSQMARHLNISPRHLERLVRKAVKLTPMQFSTRLRLRRAQWLVRNTGQSLTQIAYECGFADASHLIRHFKQEFAITPNRMRRNEMQDASKELLIASLRRWEDA
ncbi:MAG: GlxA family transcriptional regulator [Hyphomicrobiaceae bacterium]